MQQNQSASLYERAVKVMPGGVSSPVRAFRSVRGEPRFIAKGEGSYMFDVDGNRYLDFCSSWGPLILGHSHPVIRQAIHEAVDQGWTFGAPVSGEVALASLLGEKLPGFEMVRFVNSGTEAVMSAIRLARGATGRDRILKFNGCYHGHADYLLVNAGSGLATFGTASSAGVPQDFVKLTATLGLDDEAALEQAFREFGSELACVVMEPVPANNGLLLQRQAYLQKIRELCDAHGVLLIFDEVLSGFRMPKVMAYQQYGIRPDLVTLGKVIGGGMPVGAYGGSRELMSHIAPLGKVYQAGTLSGNPVAMAAGFATLKYYFENQIPEKLEKLGQHLDQVIQPALAVSDGMGYCRLGSLFWFYFDADRPPRKASEITAKSGAKYAALHAYLLDAGIYLAPSAYEVGFLNAAMTPEMLDGFAETITNGFKKGEIQ